MLLHILAHGILSHQIGCTVPQVLGHAQDGMQIFDVSTDAMSLRLISEHISLLTVPC
jgi:hypothetical protein